MFGSQLRDLRAACHFERCAEVWVMDAYSRESESGSAMGETNQFQAANHTSILGMARDFVLWLPGSSGRTREINCRCVAHLLLAAVSVVASLAPLFSQQQVGGLRVLVTDQSGSFITGAEVELSSAALIRPIVAVTDAQGLAINHNLPPGSYTVAARFPEFQTAVNKEVAVQIGRTFSVELALAVGEVEITIVVEAAAAAIDTFKSESASLYSGDRLTNARRRS